MNPRQARMVEALRKLHACKPAIRKVIEAESLQQAWEEASWVHMMWLLRDSGLDLMSRDEENRWENYLTDQVRFLPSVFIVEDIEAIYDRIAHYFRQIWTLEEVERAILIKVGDLCPDCGCSWEEHTEIKPGSDMGLGDLKCPS